MMMRLWFLLVVLAPVVLSGCSSLFGDDEEKSLTEQDATDSELYEAGLALIKEGRYVKAVERLQDIERLYPYSPLAMNSQVMTAYAYYKDLEYEEAVSTINRFLKLNPGNKNAPYMYYLKALCYYEQIADVKRDQQITYEAMDVLKEVVRRFPESEYARDAELKLDLVNDHLAGKEMEIGRFYLTQRQYLAAAQRFQIVVKEHETTNHTPEALYRLVEVYLHLGIAEEATKYAAVLGKNYPDTTWYRYAYRLLAEGKDAPTSDGDDEEGLLDAINPLDKNAEKLPRNDKVDTWFNRIWN